MPQTLPSVNENVYSAISLDAANLLLGLRLGNRPLVLVVVAAVFSKSSNSVDRHRLCQLAALFLGFRFLRVGCCSVGIGNPCTFGCDLLMHSSQLMFVLLLL